MIIKDWKKEIWTIPNLLSLFRLILIPVYVVIYLNATETAHYCIAAGILAVSCLTDLIDGKIARHFNMISTVGKILDPVADKATQFTLTVCLAIRYPMLWYLAGFIFVKEMFQLIVGYITLRKGQILSGALLTGKICTTVLFVSLIALVLFPGLSETTVYWIALVDGAFLLISLISYILAYFGKKPKIEDLNP